MRLQQDLGTRIVAFRSLILILLILTVAPCLWVILRAKLGSSAIESFVQSDEQFQKYLDEVSLFDSDVDAFIFFATDEGERLFTREKLNAIRSVARELEELEDVEQAICFVNLPSSRAGQRKSAREIAQLSLLRDRLKQGEPPRTYRRRVAPVWPVSEASQERVDLNELRESVCTDPRFHRLSVSADGHSQLMAVGIKDIYELDAPQQLRLLNEMKSILHKEGLGEEGLYVMGLPALQSFNQQQIETALLVYLPAGAVIVSVFIFLIFRRLSIVALILMIAAVANVWGIGIAIWWFGKFTILLVAVPLMVLVISTSDVIHLIAAYMADVESGMSNKKAINRMVSDVGGACVLTSFTTFFSFASLLLVPSQTMQQFGFGTAIGVGGALLLSITLTPVFLHYFPMKVSSGGTRNKGTVTRAIEGWIQGTIRIVSKFHVPLVIASLVVIAIAVWMAPRLHLDPDLIGRFRPGHLNRRSATFFNENFSGIHTVDIRLSGDPESLYSPDTIKSLKGLQSEIERLPGVAKVFSAATILEEFDREIRMNKEVRPESELGIPDSATHSIGIFKLIRKQSPRDIRRLVTDDNRTTRMLVRLKVTPFLEQHKVAREIESLVRRKLDQDIGVELSGSTPIFGAAVKEIVRGHYQGFVLCSVVILLSIMLALRSVKLGLLAVIPNLLPLGVLLMLLVSAGRADTDILAVATLSIGLAVDNSIHFLHRLKLEAPQSASAIESIGRTLRYTGRAIIQATVVLSVGFLPFAISEYSSLNMLGRHLVLVLIIALLSDLFVLPALVLVTRKWTKINEK